MSLVQKGVIWVLITHFLFNICLCKIVYLHYNCMSVVFLPGLLSLYKLITFVYFIAGSLYGQRLWQTISKGGPMHQVWKDYYFYGIFLGDFRGIGSLCNNFYWSLSWTHNLQIIHCSKLLYKHSAKINCILLCMVRDMFGLHLNIIIIWHKLLPVKSRAVIGHWRGDIYPHYENR